MLCPVCQTQLAPTDDLTIDCSDCGAPVYDAQPEELSREVLIELSQRWEKWGKQNWQTKIAAPDELESPLLGTLMRHVDKIDRWIVSNKVAIAISNRIHERIVSKPTPVTEVQGSSFAYLDSADKSEAEAEQTNYAGLPLEENGESDETIYERSAQTDTTDVNVLGAAIDEQTLIARYNRDVTMLNRQLIAVKQTERSLAQYVRGMGKTARLVTGDGGKYWAVSSDRTQNNETLYFLVLRKDIRLNQQNFNTIKACFTFANRAIPNAPFTLISPAIVRPLPDQQQWELIEKGSIEFEEPQQAGSL